jgi:hypothetical protein
MAKKERIGSDPLSWIKDTREDAEESKQEKQSVQSVQSIQSTQSKLKQGAKEGLKEGWIRATFIVREEHLEKLKDLAWWERKQLKELVDEIFSSYLEHKKIKKRETREGE